MAMSDGCPPRSALRPPRRRRCPDPALPQRCRGTHGAHAGVDLAHLGAALPGGGAHHLADGASALHRGRRASAWRVLKQLTDHGHAIGSIAALRMAQLRESPAPTLATRRRQGAARARPVPQPWPLGGGGCGAGAAAAARCRPAAPGAPAPQVMAVFDTLAEAVDAPARPRPRRAADRPADLAGAGPARRRIARTPGRPQAACGARVRGGGLSLCRCRSATGLCRRRRAAAARTAGRRCAGCLAVRRRIAPPLRLRAAAADQAAPLQRRCLVVGRRAMPRRGVSTMPP